MPMHQLRPPKRRPTKSTRIRQKAVCLVVDAQKRKVVALQSVHCFAIGLIAASHAGTYWNGENSMENPIVGKSLENQLGYGY